MITQNPYVAGSPVGSTPAFIGRADILREILRALQKTEETALLLTGQRGMGKSSILLELAAKLGSTPTFRLVYLDMQDKAALPMAQLLQVFAQTIAQGLHLPAPELGADPENTFQNRWLPALLDDMPAGQVLVLLFDHWEMLTNPAQAKAADSIGAYIRELLTLAPQQLQFVFALDRPVIYLPKTAQGLFDEMFALQVSLLSQQETLRLIHRSLGNQSLEWTVEATDAVRKTANGHPYLTQQLCASIWEQKHAAEPDTIPTAGPEDIPAAAPTALAACQNFLETLWNELPPGAQMAVSALASAGYGTSTAENLTEILKTNALPLPNRELDQALRLLQDWDWITTANGSYQIRVELFRRWLLENKPPDQVHKERDRAMPLAENLYQEALSFYREGQLEGVAELLQQTLGLNPTHVHANRLLSEVLLAQGRVAEAIAALEQLYEFQPAVARPRLIQALLSQAQEALLEDKKIEYYHRVLELDPYNPEAKEAWEVIWEGRGDAARKFGNLEAARESYQKAGVASLVSEVESEIFNRDLTAQMHLLKQLEESKQYQQALLLLRELAKSHPNAHDWEAILQRLETLNTLDQKYEQALEAITRGSPEIAIPLLQTVMQHQPNRVEVIRYLYQAISGTDPVSIGAELSALKELNEQLESDLVTAHADLQAAEEARDLVQEQMAQIQEVTPTGTGRGTRNWAIVSTLLALVLLAGFIFQNLQIRASKQQAAEAQSTLSVIAATQTVLMGPINQTIEAAAATLAAANPPTENAVLEPATNTPTPIPSATPLPTATPTTPPPTPTPTPEMAGLFLSLGEGQISDIAVSSDGQWLAVTSPTGISLYDLEDGELVWTGNTNWGMRSAAFQPDGSLLASGAANGGVVLWDILTGSQVTVLSGHLGWVWSVAFSPDGTVLASAADDNNIILWDVAQRKQIAVLSGHEIDVRTLAFSPDGQLLASGSSDNTIILWDLKSNQPLNTLTNNRGWVLSVRFSPDGTMLASGSLDGATMLWEIPSGILLKTLEGHTSTVWRVAFSPDGSLVAAGSDDRTIIIWDVTTGEIVSTLEGHTGTIWSVLFTPDGQRVISGAADGHVIIWDLP